MVAAHGAVALDSSHHEGLDVNDAGAGHLHRDHIETLPGQVVTWDERKLLTLGEVAGLTAQRSREEEEEEEEEPMTGRGEHRRTEGTEVKQTETYRNSLDQILQPSNNQREIFYRSPNRPKSNLVFSFVQFYFRHGELFLF